MGDFIRMCKAVFVKVHAKVTEVYHGARQLHRLPRIIHTIKYMHIKFQLAGKIIEFGSAEMRV